MEIKHYSTASLSLCSLVDLSVGVWVARLLGAFAVGP